MGIPYSPTIPAAGNNPSDDQPLMQQNYQNLQTLINVDHIDFADASYGKHNKTSYIAQTVAPTVASGEITFFSQTSGGVTNVYYKHDTDATVYQLTNGGNVNAASAGYSYLPGGVLMQWRSLSATGAFTWPVTFPTACWGVTATYNSVLAADTPVIQFSAVTTTGATLSALGSGGTIFLIAVGN